MMPEETHNTDSNGELLPAPTQMETKTEEQTSTPADSEPKTTQKKKKKRKKKKVSTPLTEAPLSDSNQESGEPLTFADTSTPETPTEAEEVIQTIITLPAKPDEWFIKPETYDETGNLLTEETFTFLKNGIEIINLPLNEKNFQTLTILLNEKFNPQTETPQADYFHVRKPLLGSDELNPIMTLTQKNVILATTELDQKTLKRLIRALQQHVITTSPMNSWFKRWWGKHKIARVFLVIASAPVAFFLIYALLWGTTL